MTCGEYKSAGEMFMRRGPSEEADRMTNWLLDGMYENSVGLIAKGRSVTPEVARGWIDGGIYTAQELGWIGATFLWGYGAGKLVNGLLADRVSARAFLAAGIGFSGLLNLVMGCNMNVWIAMGLWLAKRYFLS